MRGLKTKTTGSAWNDGKANGQRTEPAETLICTGFTQTSPRYADTVSRVTGCPSLCQFLSPDRLSVESELWCGIQTCIQVACPLGCRRSSMVTSS
jgi:hypothetical protein